MLCAIDHDVHIFGLWYRCLLADEAVEPALEVAHSMVEQFLPELAEPLKARCGEVCQLKALYDQLNAFQDALLPPDKESADSEETARWSNGEGGPSKPPAFLAAVHCYARKLPSW